MEVPPGAAHVAREAGKRLANELRDAVMDLTVRPVTAGQWPALEDLFGRAGASNGCWCMYWRIGPRYRDRPREDNKRDLERLARSRQPPGLLAFDGGNCVGWCELAPRADLDWLARGRHFPRDSGGTYTRRMNWGEYVHFTSGAAAADMSGQAARAFGWPRQWAGQLEHARAQFPAITY